MDKIWPYYAFNYMIWHCRNKAWWDKCISRPEIVVEHIKQNVCFRISGLINGKWKYRETLGNFIALQSIVITIYIVRSHNARSSFVQFSYNLTFLIA